MAFSSVRENVTPNTQLELCWKMLLFIILYVNLILNFKFYLIPSFQVLISFHFCICTISIMFISILYQQMLLLYIYCILFNRCYCCLFYWL